MESEKKVPGKHRNRLAGHGFELRCRDILRSIGFPFVVTSRSESKSRDDDKVDLLNENEVVNGRLPYNIQCKNTTTIINYDAVFRGYNKYKAIKRGPFKGTTKKISVSGMPKIPGVINVIWHKFTEQDKAIDGTKFLPQGHYVIMCEEDFIQIMKERKELEELRSKKKEWELVPTLARHDKSQENDITN